MMSPLPLSHPISQNKIRPRSDLFYAFPAILIDSSSFWLMFSKMTIMLVIIFFILIIGISACFFQYLRERLGINDATFSVLMKDGKWTAKSSWKDKFTKQEHTIVTCCDILNRIESVYDDSLIHYQSKEPASGVVRIIQYHSTARRWYFNRMMLQYIKSINIREHFTVIYLQICTRILAVKLPKIEITPRIYKIFRSRNTDLEAENVEAARRMII